MVMTCPIKANPSCVVYWKTCIDKCVLDYLKFIHLLTFCSCSQINVRKKSVDFLVFGEANFDKNIKSCF